MKHRGSFQFENSRIDVSNKKTAKCNRSSILEKSWEVKKAPHFSLRGLKPRISFFNYFPLTNFTTLRCFPWNTSA
jgi:hypothetical protein